MEDSLNKLHILRTKLFIFSERI